MGDGLGRYLAGVARHPWLAEGAAPWRIAAAIGPIVGDLFGRLVDGYAIGDGIALHERAVVEAGAVLKGPLIVGPGCFIAAGAYLRGGVFLEEDCTIGPGCEVKTSIILARSKLAHFNFVGDSLIGEDVNMEAGSIIANYRNESDDKAIRVMTAAGVVNTGVEKFGAVVGDGTRIGANAVLSPGTLLPPKTVVPRLALVDQLGRQGT